MFRFLIASCLLAAMLGMPALPASALTHEEVLKRRLEKMQEADARLRQEAEQRRIHEQESAATVDVRPDAPAADLSLTMPSSVPRPGPEPRQGLWAKGTAPAATTAAPAAPARTATPPAPAVEPAPVVKAPAVRDPHLAASLAAQSEKAKAKGDLAGAIALLDQAIVADPDSPDLHNNRGNARNDSGHPKEALADYDRAIRLKPSAAYFANRGLAHERLGNPEQACADYKNACERGECSFFKSYKQEGHCR